jgi:hypothetical protein
MRTLAIRAAALLLVAILIAVTVVVLSQPRALTNFSPPVPTVECSPGVSPAQSFCYAR